jgi:CrcB protein
MKLLYVFLGGGLGASLRWGVSLLVPGALGTQVVNVIGSLGLALVLTRLEASPQLKLLLGTGLMGGFTTYSTFNSDTLRHLEAGEPLRALANVLLTLSLCLGAGVLGLWLGRR